VEAGEFWAEARRRRNYFFYAWVGWLIVGFPLFALWRLVLGFAGLGDEPAGVAALFTWGSFWIWLAYRVRDLRCFHCGERAFSNPYFFMAHARCRSCGVRYRDA
jgi:hypothetical protein